MKHRFLFLVVALFTLTTLHYSPVSAAANGVVFFTGLGTTAPICDNGRLNMTITWTGTTADFNNLDWIAVVSEDGDGDPLDISYFGMQVGLRIPTGNYTDMDAFNAIDTRPVILTLYDVGDPSPIAPVYGPNSPESYAFATGSPLMDQDVIDPADVIASCASLPGAVPNRLAPTDESGVATTKPQFSWDSLWGATRYEIQLEPMNPPSTTVFSGTALSYTSASVLLVQPYYWRIRAIYGTAYVSDWSSAWSVYIAPNNAAPPRANYTMTTPRLTWSAITWSAGYWVEVDNLTNFGSPNYSKDDLSANNLFVTTTALSEGTWYWRVRAKRDDGTWGTWSASQSFTIDVP